MPSALVMTAAGINCDGELARAFALAGCDVESIHITQLLETPALVDRFDLIGLPGGFSYGDAVAAGRITAQLVRRGLYAALVRAVERGAPIIAPCNGFQIAVQAGLLPGPAEGAAWPQAPARPTVTLAENASARFVDRWVRMEIPANTRCVWTRGLDVPERTLVLPIAHGEGRFIAESDDEIARLEATGCVAIRYAEGDDPNGSAGRVAGICDASGLVFGLMPHPERYTRWTHHPFWTRLDDEETSGEPLGLQMFKNAVACVSNAAAV